MKTKHTAEPWEYAWGAIYARAASTSKGKKPMRYLTEHDRVASPDRNNPYTSPTERDANARRIVECVNACEGVTDFKALKHVLAAIREGAYLDLPTSVTATLANIIFKE